jgi:hypothetical protein
MICYDKVLFDVSFYDESLPTYRLNLDEAVVVLQRWNDRYYYGNASYVNTPQTVWNSWSHGDPVIKEGLKTNAIVGSVEPFIRQFLEEKKFRQKIDSNIKDLLCLED